MPNPTGKNSKSLNLPNTEVKSEPRCNICKSALRPKIDRLIAAQFADTSIAEELISGDEDFKHKSVDTVRKNVERHRKLHLDLRNRAVREIIERRAKEMGILVESATGQITSGRALLDLVVARATEQVIDPEQRVKIADAIEAVKMLEDTQRTEYMAQLEMMERQVAAISAAVREMVPQQLLPALIDRAKQIFDDPDKQWEAVGGGIKRRATLTAGDEVVEGTAEHV